MLSTSLQPLIAVALVPGLIFFALPAYRAGNDPLVLTGAAAALSLCLLTVSLPRVRGRALHLILPLGLIVLVQLLALGANSLGCAPPVAAATAADLSAPQWFPCTLRFANSLYALLQTWVVIASGLLGFAVAGRVPVGRFNAVLVFAALVFGGLGAVRMVFDPLVLPGSAGFVNPNSLSTLLVVALLCWMQQSSGPVLDHLRSGRFIAVTGPLLLGLLLVVALVMTQSRLGMFVGLCACGLLVLVELGRRMTRYQLLHLATLLVVLALAVVALQAVAWVNRVGDIHGSLLSRLSIYEQGAQLWLKGIAFGVGAGTFEVVLPVVNTDPVLAEKLWTKAHSTYLALYIEQGIFGLIAHLYAFAAVVLILLGEWWRRRSSAAGLGLVIVFAIGAHSVFDFSMEIPGVAASVAAVLGAILHSGMAATNGPQAAAEPDV